MYNYLHDLSAIATYWLNNFNLEINGRLQTHNTRDRQSDYSLIYPFFELTLKFGSDYAIEY